MTLKQYRQQQLTKHNARQTKSLKQRVVDYGCSLDDPRKANHFKATVDAAYYGLLWGSTAYALYATLTWMVG